MNMLNRWIYRNKLIQLLLLALLLGASIVLQSYSIVQIVNLVFIENGKFPIIYSYLILLFIGILFRLSTKYWIGKIGGMLAAKAKLTVRQQLLTHWSKHSFEHNVSSQTGEKVTLLVDTVDQLESYYRQYIPQMIQSIVVSMAVLVTVFTIHSNSGWIMLVTAPFIPLTYILIGLQTKAKSEEQLNAMNKFSGKFIDLLQGLQTVRLFGQSKQQEAILAAHNKGFMDRTLSVLKIAFASTLFIELITTLSIGLIALEIGFQMIVFQTLTFAPAFFVLTLAPDYYNSLKELGSAFHTGRGSLGAATIIEEQLNEPIKEVKWGQQLVATRPSITLQNGTVHYATGPTIGPISMHIVPGQTIALIGQTGHGKTTILNMLSSFVELDRGELLLNDVPRSTVKEQQWYEQMGYISQHPYIFAGTLRDNILMGMVKSDEEIYEALKKAQLTEWIQSIPDGLNVKLGEGGIGLSGGERQRIALARAFLKKPSILFFDEPTAGLDVGTEKLLTESLQILGNDATVIIVAHQFESIRYADVIYVIENGQVVASGTHKQLQSNTYYMKMKKKGSDFDEATELIDMER